jgi:hypothetical protein
MIVVIVLIFDCLKKGVRKGEEFKAPCYASAAAIRDYITIYNIIPNTGNSSFVVAIYIQIPLN